MKLEPNLLLATSTGFALILVITTATVFGAPDLGLRNVLMAVACAGGFVLLNPWLSRQMKMPERRPMIHPDNPGGALWSGLFPLLVLTCAGIPVIWPDHDYGLLVIIAAVWFGVTAESAIKAQNQAG